MLAFTFTRYCVLFHFTKLYCGIELIILVLPPPPTSNAPTLLQYYCTPIAQYTPRHRPLHLNAIHQTILVMTISGKIKGKGQAPRSCTDVAGQGSNEPKRVRAESRRVAYTGERGRSVPCRLSALPDY